MNTKKTQTKKTARKDNFGKILQYCIDNKINTKLGNYTGGSRMDNDGIYIEIWILRNVYLNIGKFFNWTVINGRRIPTQKKRRTTLTVEVFDIETYKPNGEARNGSYSARINFKEMMQRLEAINDGVDYVSYNEGGK